MILKEPREVARKRRHLRVRKKVFGTKQRPRLVIFKSLKHIYTQIINDEEGTTMVAASTLDPAIKDSVSGCNAESAKKVGELIARKALEKGIKDVAFDRSGYMYHGCVKAFADAAREAGLNF